MQLFWHLVFAEDYVYSGMYVNDRAVKIVDPPAFVTMLLWLVI